MCHTSSICLLLYDSFSVMVCEIYQFPSEHQMHIVYSFREGILKTVYVTCVGEYFLGLKKSFFRLRCMCVDYSCCFYDLICSNVVHHVTVVWELEVPQAKDSILLVGQIGLYQKKKGRKSLSVADSCLLTIL